MNSIQKQIVGILNLTPNSFSDGFRESSHHAAQDIPPDTVQERVSALLDQKPDILELGAVATSMGSSEISVEEELHRIRMAVNFLPPNTYFSVDTYRAAAAELAIRHGAQMINDTSALRMDAHLAEVIARSNVQVVIMYAKDSPSPHVTEFEPVYGDVVQEIGDFLEARMAYALSRGIRREKIILDPGMGKFISHDPERSWEVLRRLGEFRQRFPMTPLFLSVSRKSFLGGPVDQRDEITSTVSLEALEKGVTYVRVHNVRLLREHLSMHSKQRQP